MSLSRIRTNLQAQLALQNLNQTNSNVGSIQEKLQTGKRINKAADDSAGYSIAAKLRARVGGQAQALRNVGDAKSILNVAEGGMNTIQDMLQQMKEKVVQGANDSNGSEERKAIRTELKALSEEIQTTLDETSFNGNKLFTDDPGGTDFTFQVNAEKGDTFDVKIDRLSNDSLGVTNGTTEAKLVGKGLSLTSLTQGDVTYTVPGSTVASGEVEFEITSRTETAAGTVAISFEGTGSFEDNSGTVTSATVSTGSVTLAGGGGSLEIALGGNSLQVGVDSNDTAFKEGDSVFVSVDNNQLNVVDNDSAGDSLKVIDSAISEISAAVSNLGDAQNRLSFKADNLNTAKINNEAARSQIEDADFAFQQVQLAKQQILQQTNISAVAQANAAPQSVLSLVG
jgi:flagellin